MRPPAAQPDRLAHLLRQPRPHRHRPRAGRAGTPGGGRANLHLLLQQADLLSPNLIVDSEQILPSLVQSECAGGGSGDASEDRGGEGFASRAYLCQSSPGCCQEHLPCQKLPGNCGPGDSQLFSDVFLTLPVVRRQLKLIPSGIILVWKYTFKLSMQWT